MDAIAEFFHQHNRRLATLTCILMVILMSASVARGTWFFVENLTNQTIAAPAKEQSRQSSGTNSDSLDLASLNLFGRVQDEAAEIVDAPETRLNLELQGVFTEAGRKHSTAIVAEGNKAGELYHIGDRLPGNATLAEVFDNYILIRRGNRMEKLTFDDNALRTEPGSSSPGASSRTTQGSGADSSVLKRVRDRIGARRRDVSIEGTPASNSSFREQIEEYRQRLDDNPEEVMAELGIRSVEAGNTEGYEVDGDVSNVALQRAGLQQGDVILSVNGQPVGDVNTDKALVEQAMAAGRVRVEVQRGSRRFYLTVPIPDR